MRASCGASEVGRDWEPPPRGAPWGALSAVADSARKELPDVFLCSWAAMTSSSNAVGGAGEHASGAIGGATEHASGRIAMASDPQKMTLEDAIVTLEAHGDLDDRGANILAAATTLRDIHRARLPSSLA